MSLSPASVVEILRVVLASRRIPSLSSRDFTVWLMAEGVTPISAAALVKLFSLATVKKTFNSSTRFLLLGPYWRRQRTSLSLIIK